MIINATAPGYVKISDDKLKVVRGGLEVQNIDLSHANTILLVKHGQSVMAGIPLVIA